MDEYKELAWLARHAEAICALVILVAVVVVLVAVGTQ